MLHLPRESHRRHQRRTHHWRAYPARGRRPCSRQRLVGMVHLSRPRRCPRLLPLPQCPSRGDCTSGCTSGTDGERTGAAHEPDEHEFLRQHRPRVPYAADDDRWACEPGREERTPQRRRQEPAHHRQPQYPKDVQAREPADGLQQARERHTAAERRTARRGEGDQRRVRLLHLQCPGEKCHHQPLRYGGRPDGVDGWRQAGEDSHEPHLERPEVHTQRRTHRREPRRGGQPRERRRGGAGVREYGEDHRGRYGQGPA